MASRLEISSARRGNSLRRGLCLLLLGAACVSAQGTRNFKSTLMPDTAGTSVASTSSDRTAADRPAARPVKAPAAALVNPVMRRDTSGRHDSIPTRAADSLLVPPRADSTAADSSDATAAEESQGRRLRFEFYEVEDPELLSDLWKMTGRDSTPEEGHYQVLKVRDDSTTHAYLLREGTQVGRIPDSLVAGLRRAIRMRSGTQEGRVSQNIFGNFWNPVHPLAPFQWPTGLFIELRHSASIVQDANPEFEQTYGTWLAVRPVPWAHAEAGYFRSHYSGGLTRNLYDPGDNIPDGPFWNTRQSWGYVALGVPGIKYELGLDNRSIPEYFWLDPHAGSGSYALGREKAGTPLSPSEDFPDATVIKGWKQGGRTQPPKENFSQTLRLKVGQVHYSAVFDPDVYNSVIHDVMFQDLPTPFGQMGLGFVFAQGAAHTRLLLDFFPVNLGLPVPRGSSFNLLFLRLEVAMRDTRTFHIGLASLIHLDSPILRPGGNP